MKHSMQVEPAIRQKSSKYITKCGLQLSFALTFPPFRHKRSSNYVYISTVHHNLVCPLCNLSRTTTYSSVLTFIWVQSFYDPQFSVFGVWLLF